MFRSILITGATGLIGKYLVKLFLQDEFDIILLTQKISNAQKTFPSIKKIISWDNISALSKDKIEVIINLAGTNLDAKRWTGNFKKEIYDSRIESTRKIVELIGKMGSKPEVLINASGVDFYGDTGDRDIGEDAPMADSFMGNLVNDWEAEALKAQKFGVRVVCLRTGFVVSRNSKAFKKMLMPLKYFVGGFAGSGKQYLSWIDIDDLVRIYSFCVNNKSMTGAVNASSPYPETMKNFSKQIGKLLHRPAFFRVPAFVLKIMFGGISELILSGRKALPVKLLNAGFSFRFEHAIDSLKKEIS